MTKKVENYPYYNYFMIIPKILKEETTGQIHRDDLEKKILAHLGKDKKIVHQNYSFARMALEVGGYISVDKKTKIVTITEKTRNSTLTDDELKKALKESRSNNGEKGEAEPNDLINTESGDDLSDLFDEQYLENYLYLKYINNSNLEKKVFEKYKELIDKKKQVIFQGAPGTGKSYLAQIFTDLLTNDNSEQYEVVQFHPSYSYEDFIQGYRPTESGGFELKEGLFMKICEEASKESNKDKNFVLFVDEINRGNLSKIFGEMLYLLEYREKNVKLTYSPNTKFSIPKNLYIIGTMNTADRSLAMVDYALRRRFGFISLKPDYKILKKLLQSNGSKNTFIDTLITNLSTVNEKIAANPSLGSGFEIGHSYFVKEKNLDLQKLEAIWEFEIMPLLEEYFYEDLEEVENLRKILFDNL
jgi:5-methylcytosine-specific restriction endonuclease McrBC GTP-binding regulatory subunit McrB